MHLASVIPRKYDIPWYEDYWGWIKFVKLTKLDWVFFVKMLPKIWWEDWKPSECISCKCIQSLLNNVQLQYSSVLYIIPILVNATVTEPPPYHSQDHHLCNVPSTTEFANWRFVELQGELFSDSEGQVVLHEEVSECISFSILWICDPSHSLWSTNISQECKFSGNCLNSGLHEAQIPALLFIFSPFWRLLVQIHTLFQAFALWSAYISVSVLAVTDEL